MHWPEDQALRTDVAYIALACETHVEMMNVVHLGAKPTPRKRAAKVTAADFRAFARDHNAAFERQSRGRTTNG